jgi:hypothetical protein
MSRPTIADEGAKPSFSLIIEMAQEWSRRSGMRLFNLFPIAENHLARASETQTSQFIGDVRFYFLGLPGGNIYLKYAQSMCADISAYAEMSAVS